MRWVCFVQKFAFCSLSLQFAFAVLTLARLISQLTFHFAPTLVLSQLLVPWFAVFVLVPDGSGSVSLSASNEFPQAACLCVFRHQNAAQQVRSDTVESEVDYVDTSTGTSRCW